jgi:hypothetical protein
MNENGDAQVSKIRLTHKDKYYILSLLCGMDIERMDMKLKGGTIRDVEKEKGEKRFRKASVTICIKRLKNKYLL